MRTIQKKTAKSEDGFKFEVGALYENMKGVYEVISIQEDSMTIRWKDGNEVVTPVDLQQRIIERLAYEKKMQQDQAEKKSHKKKARPTSNPKGDSRDD